MEKKKLTYCRICEAACGLELVQSGEKWRLLPDKAHPVSQGYMCAKGTRFVETAMHRKRLMHPMKRLANGRLQKISWEEANALFAEKVRPIVDQYGPHSVAVYYGNPLLFNALGLVSVLTFNRALGTRNVFSSFSQDCNNKFAAATLLHGSPLVHPIPDLEQADFALLLGSNPAVSQGSFWHIAQGANGFDAFIKRGGEALFVDPRLSESAQRWGTHLPIRAGTDLFLLLALLNELRDLYQPSQYESGLTLLLAVAEEYPAEKTAVLTNIPAAQIQQLAQKIRQTQHVTFHMSVGVNMGPFGTLAYVALQGLAFLTGNFDKAGGLLFNPMGRQLSVLLDWLKIGATPEPSRIGGLTGVFDELPGAILADEILTPGAEQVRVLINIAGNPAHSIPGETRLKQALEALDFQVHIDLFENRTGKTADLLLPATSWLERWDVATTTGAFQTGGMLQYGEALLPAPEETRPERRIMTDLADGLGIKMPLARLWRWNGLDGALTKLLNGMSCVYRRRNNGRFGLPTVVPKAGRYLGRGPRTPRQQVRFWHEALAGEPARLASFAAQLEKETTPFVLSTRRRRLGHNSWLHGAKVMGNDKETAVWLSPADAARLGVEKGDSVCLENGINKLLLPVQPNPTVADGSVVVPHGLPNHNVNSLIPSGAENVEPVSGNHWMTGIPIAVVKVETSMGSRSLSRIENGRSPLETLWIWWRGKLRGKC